MTILGAIFTILVVAGVMTASRRGAVLALLAGVCYITQGQQIMIGGFHFFASRLIVLAALIRIFMRGEAKGIQVNRIDLALVGYALAFAICTMVRVGTSQAVVNQLGSLYDILLAYWIFRWLVRDWQEVMQLLPSIAWLVVPLGMCMVIEMVTTQNVFAAMGGQGWEAVFREDRLRCMASFRAPHTIGIFGATLVPLFACLYFVRHYRAAAVAGLMSSVAIVYCSNSSGPLLALLCCLLGLAFWPMRTRMKQVRWGLLVFLGVLHLAMKPPVYYIFAKISDVVGGDGWSRSYLMDQCLRHFSRWWFIGTENTGDWAATLMAWGGADICNQYVSAAVGGGLLGLVLFIAIPVLCFRRLGLALNSVRGESAAAEKLFWCLGCILFSHVVAIFSITYFDQMHIVWWGTLAMISSITSPAALKAQGPVAVESLEEPLVGESGYVDGVDRIVPL